MTFGYRKITGAKSVLELIRYAPLRNVCVIGGAGKLLKHFIRTYNPEKLISYADRRFSLGDLYYQLGFKLKHISKPNYWYFPKSDPMDIKSRISFQKHKLSKKLPNFNIKKTEWENMQINGYDRIWDCGNYVFEYKK